MINRRGLPRLCRSVFIAVGITALIATPSFGDDQPVVELMIFGTGTHLYTRFGHSALRVTKMDGTDLVYNFGYTDFSNYLLIIDTLRGRARFWLQVVPFDRTWLQYVREDRTIQRYPLQIPLDGHRKLADRLAQIANSSDKYYFYDHFRNNCATRIRDLLDEQTQGALQRHWQTTAHTASTYRDEVRRGLRHHVVLLLLSEIVVGRIADLPISLWQATFLPNSLASAAQRQVPNAGILAGPAETLYRSETQAVEPQKAPNTGAFALWIFSAVIAASAGLLVVSSKYNWPSLLRIGVRMLVMTELTILLGITLLAWTTVLMATVAELRQNELLLYFWPTDAMFVWMMGRRCWMAGKLENWHRIRFGFNAYRYLKLSILPLAIAGHATGVLYQQPQQWLVVYAASLWLWRRVLLDRLKPAPMVLPATPC